MHTRRHLRYSKSKAERFLPLACVIFLFPSRLAIGVEVVQVAPSQPWQKSLHNAAVEGKAGRLHQRLQTPLPTHSCRAGTLVLPDNVSAFTIIMHLAPGWGVHTAYSIYIKWPKALGDSLNGRSRKYKTKKPHEYPSLQLCPYIHQEQTRDFQRPEVCFALDAPVRFQTIQLKERNLSHLA